LIEGGCQSVFAGLELLIASRVDPKIALRRQLILKLRRRKDRGP